MRVEDVREKRSIVSDGLEIGKHCSLHNVSKIPRESSRITSQSFMGGQDLSVNTALSVGMGLKGICGRKTDLL